MTSILLNVIIFVVVLLVQTWGMEYQYNGGHKIPVIGLGTYTVTNEAVLSNAINKALEIGYRHIDTAASYKNEHLIGKVLKEWISSGKVKREDLFITTKLDRTAAYPNNVAKALNESLEKLQLDYVDLYLIHFPVAIKVSDDKKLIPQPTDLVSLWREMEKQVDAGKTKTIGVSNFNISQIERIKKNCRIQPANLQIELNAYFQQHKICDYAKKNNITVVCYSPLGSPGVNAFYQLNNRTKVDLPDILNDETIQAIAKKHNKTSAQIALRFLVQSDIVIIPKSTNPKRLQENIDILDFRLDDNDMKSMRQLDKGAKAKIFLMTNIKDIINHPEYPFHENL